LAQYYVTFASIHQSNEIDDGAFELENVFALKVEASTDRLVTEAKTIAANDYDYRLLQHPDSSNKFFCYEI